MGYHLASLGYKRLLFLLSGILCAAQLGLAQGQEEWEGEIENVEIEILRERQITLPRANRNFEKVPPRPSEPIVPEITYQLRNFKFELPGYQPALKPLRLKQEEISRIYGNYVGAGFGNFSSPYLEAWTTTKRDKNRLLGAHFYHRSFRNGPVDDRNSASGNTQVKIFGSNYSEFLTATGFASFQNNLGYFYGYTPGTEVDRDSIRQSYNRFSVGGTLGNTKPSDFNFKLRSDFSYLTDSFEANESMLNLQFDGDYATDDQHKILISSAYHLFSRNDDLVDSKVRHLFRAGAAFQFSPMENLLLTAGAKAAIDNDSIRNSKFHLYPDIHATYTLSANVSAYASLTGDMDRVSLHALSEGNQWLNSNVSIFHTNRTIDFTVGLKGKVGNLAFVGGVAAANLNESYFYQNALANRAKFDVVYDDLKRLNIFGEATFGKGEVAQFSARGDYFNYSTDDLAEAWHRPTYRFGLNTRFNIYEKVVLAVGLAGQGGMKAFNNESLQQVDLEEAIDLNAKLDYFLSKQVSVFVKLENILSNDYPVFLNYPVRGFQAMGGVKWSF